METPDILYRFKGIVSTNPYDQGFLALSVITEFLVNKVNEITDERNMWKARCDELEQQLNKEKTK